MAADIQERGSEYIAPAEALTSLRSSVPEDLIGSPDSISAAIGETGLNGLRRHYFPRYRAGRVVTAGSLPHRKILVEDQWEHNLVAGIAPPANELETSIIIEAPEDPSVA